MAAAGIEFVRHYTYYREDWFEVMYKNGKLFTYTLTDLPNTVKKFLESCKEEPSRWFDPILKIDKFTYRK